jgi:hypothetical protein
VKANDADGPGGDSKVTYSIRDGNGLGRFTIDADDGVVRTNEILDRETQRLYWLTVYAQDRGAVPLFSTIEVRRCAIGVWQGVVMNSLKFRPGPPCPRRVGGLRPSSTLLDTPRRTPMRCVKSLPFETSVRFETELV